MSKAAKINEKSIKELFIGECWLYLRSNFSKFSEANKIKIALTLAQKDMPQEMSGNFNVNQMPAIQKSSGEAQPNVNLEFNIGAPVTTTNPKPSQ